MPHSFPTRRSSDLEGTAAGGQDERPAGEQPRDHPALALAKIALAKAREDVGDGHAGGALDLVVGVGEGQAEPLCETAADRRFRSEEHTSELQSLMRISYAVFCLKKKKIARE